MTKSELIELLENLGIPFSEGIQNDKDIHEYPRMVIHEMVIDPIVSSGVSYTDTVTYQVSMFSDIPRPQKLIDLRVLLREKKLNPVIYSEFVEDNGGFIHYTFSLDVLENVG